MAWEWEKGSQAQLAHDKATMVKLPSEDELLNQFENDLGVLWDERDHEGFIKELLRLLGGKP
jgi:hypothetical protein